MDPPCSSPIILRHIDMIQKFVSKVSLATVVELLPALS